MRARLVHRLLVVGAQYISFEAANLQLVYKQAGMPGPRPTPDSPLAGMDAVCLDMRKISLEPQGMQTVPPRHSDVHVPVTSLHHIASPALL